jgi:hypothetical protein
LKEGRLFKLQNIESRLGTFCQLGFFYAQGVKASVLFFDLKPASERPWTDKLWIYECAQTNTLPSKPTD